MYCHDHLLFKSQISNEDVDKYDRPEEDKMDLVMLRS